MDFKIYLKLTVAIIVGIMINLGSVATGAAETRTNEYIGMSEPKTGLPLGALYAIWDQKYKGKGAPDFETFIMNATPEGLRDLYNHLYGSLDDDIIYVNSTKKLSDSVRLFGTKSGVTGDVLTLSQGKDLSDTSFDTASASNALLDQSSYGARFETWQGWNDGNRALRIKTYAFDESHRLLFFEKLTTETRTVTVERAKIDLSAFGTEVIFIPIIYTNKTENSSSRISPYAVSEFQILGREFKHEDLETDGISTELDFGGGIAGMINHSGMTFSGGIEYRRYITDLAASKFLFKHHLGSPEAVYGQGRLNLHLWGPMVLQSSVDYRTVNGSSEEETLSCRSGLSWDLDAMTTSAGAMLYKERSKRTDNEKSESIRAYIDVNLPLRCWAECWNFSLEANGNEDQYQAQFMIGHNFSTESLAEFFE